MAAWQGREEPSARQGSKLDPTPASFGGVPPGGPGGQVGRQVEDLEVLEVGSGRPQQEETAAWQVAVGVGGVLPVTSLQEPTR